MGWTHRMCGECWIEKEVGENPDSAAIRAPVQFIDATPSVCCLCQQPTRLGIYIRRDPATTKCGEGCEAETS